MACTTTWIIRINDAMARVVVSVTNDLVGDRRVAKVCGSLHDAGHDVLLLGCIKGRTGEIRTPYRVRRMKMLARRGFLFYMEYNVRLFFILLFTRKDVLLCNDTDALVANYAASVVCRRPLVFDAHELFPEVPELVGRRFVKWFWTKIEDFIFPRLRHCYTVCQSIADYYANRYGTRMGVVRNIPVMTMPQLPAVLPSAVPVGKKMLLYQGAVNVGRGLEWVIPAMRWLDDCVLVICGNGDLLDEMKALAVREGVAERVVFTGRIPAGELDAYTVQADAGLVLLDNLGLSYYYSLPNRIFDFMKFGVPVLATDFPEIRRVVDACKSGLLTSTHDPQEVARLIREMLSEWGTPAVKERIRAQAARFDWRNEAKIVLATVDAALQHK